MTARLVVACAVAAALPRTAGADGEVSLRGAYYKERATRVAQPMVDARFDVGNQGELRAHTAVDSISSASVAAGAAGEPFDETRYELGATYLHRVDRYRFGGGGRVSTEPDYKSGFVTLRGEAELFEKNTTLTLNLAGGHDRVTNGGTQNAMVEPIGGTLDTALASIGVTQVLSPILVGQLTYDLSYLDGFQENPYRTVSAGGVLELERVPDIRVRHAGFASLRAFVEVTRSTVVGGYRFYADDWGVIGHTPEARLIQEVTPSLDIHLRYRLHHQSAADFYETTYPSADPAIEPYLTDDAKLSSLTTQNFGVKVDVALPDLGAGSLNGARAEAMFEYITQTTYFGDAILAQLALTVPFQY